MIASELFNFNASGGGALEFKRSKAIRRRSRQRLLLLMLRKEIRNAFPAILSGSSDILGVQEEEALQQISGSESIFTWEDVEYSVPYMGDERKLLNKISGYAKPGVSK